MKSVMNFGFNRNSKRAQSTMEMPFGIIFAIILIVIFLVVAFIAVNHFLNIGSCSSVGLFYDEFQKKVDSAWEGQEMSFDFKVSVPSGITKICFANLSKANTGSQGDYDEIKNYDVYDANTFLLPPGKACSMPYKLIKHMDIANITKSKNPYCVDLTQRDVLRIKKGFYDKFVTVE